LKSITQCFNMILILGGGRYGTIALRKLSGRSERVIVVDADPMCEASKYVERITLNYEIPQKSSLLVLGDGISFLIYVLERKVIPDFVIFTVPRNVVASFLASQINTLGRRVEFDVPSMLAAAERIPDRYLVAKDMRYAVIVASYAKNHICMNGCMQPDVCPVSGEKHERTMVEILRDAVKGDYVRIFESKLLDKGVGGVSGAELFEFYRNIKNIEHGTHLAVGTACKCHGIVNFMKVI